MYITDMKTLRNSYFNEKKHQLQAVSQRILEMSIFMHFKDDLI